MDKILKECISDLSEFASSQAVQINWEIACKASIDADQDMLSIALHNIIENAIKYSFQGQEVIIRLQVDDTDVKITVSNYGIGIPSSQLKDVFNLYWRGNIHYGRKVIVGSGIGLTVAKLIIEQHEGFIILISSPPKQSDEKQGYFSQDDINNGLNYTTEAIVTLPLRKEDTHE